jgi:hypothetical protein
VIDVYGVLHEVQIGFLNIKRFNLS